MVLRGSRILRAALLVAAVILLGALGREVLPSVFPPALPSGPEPGAGGGPASPADPAGTGFAAGPLRIETPPAAVAILEGGPLAPEIQGQVLFFESNGGATVAVGIRGLPPYRPAEGDQDPVGPHGFHIHEFGTCEVGDPQDPFLAAGGHWNPEGKPHGDHPGDFPVIFSNPDGGGVSVMTFFTDEFRPADVVGRSVIVHLHPDDYRTQPAGASGPRLACGVIEPASGQGQ
ncbi:MAG: hypothetical protein DIU84_00540 [Bacillota bacterium]|mgnify:CR=1 FL=1|nr:hypothetical protein [Bacillota bacterium]REJ38334.1 MAG: hypothetical protein DIU84_00540 [Bacillota bacterium]